MTQAYSETVIALLARNPFYYSWVLQMKYKASEEVSYLGITYEGLAQTATLLVNETALETITLKNRLFLLEHEVLHWIYEHPLQEEYGDPLYDVACDMSINGMLEHQGAALLQDSMTAKRFLDSMQKLIPPSENIEVGMPRGFATSHAYYTWIKWVIGLIPPSKNEGSGENSGSGDGASEMNASAGGAEGESGGGEGSSGESQETDNEEGEESEDGSSKSAGDNEQTGNEEAPQSDVGDMVSKLAESSDHSHWESATDDPNMKESVQFKLSQEMSTAKEMTDPDSFQKYCGDVAGKIAQLIASGKKSKLPWHHYTRRFLGYCGGVQLRATSGQLNKYGQPPKIKALPGTHIAFLLDTSSSVGKKELAACLSEIEAAHRSGVQIDVIQFDFAVQDIKPFRRSEEYAIKGRGGTSFINALTHVRGIWKRKNYTGIIILTDGAAPKPTPDLIFARTMWVCTTDEVFPEHCGEVVRLKVQK